MFGAVQATSLGFTMGACALVSLFGLVLTYFFVEDRLGKEMEGKSKLFFLVFTLHVWQERMKRTRHITLWNQKNRAPRLSHEQIVILL